MLFNSLEFLVFFLATTAVFFLLPGRFRNWWLLGTSIFFYMSWSPPFILLILYTTTIDYFVALRIQRSTSLSVRRSWLALSMVTNFAALFIFKYYNFFASVTARVQAAVGLAPTLPLLHIILPIGISFYTFEAVSYTVDVYRRVYRAEASYPRLLLFITFFPKLIAGPIERAWHLIPQFERTTTLEQQRLTSGLRLMAWGFLKKLVIADQVAGYVSAVYDHPAQVHGLPVLIATYFFAFQIFCDFSAYSDIAIGAARILGYDLLQNFRQPYHARSIPDFWRRWHISLSTWFRDYLYIPLGGNRVSPQRLYINLLCVFVISGIWHGASWTFVVWGALHGFYFVTSVVGQRFRERVWAHAAAVSRGMTNTVRPWIETFITFHLVVLAWIFFRARSVSDAGILLRNLLEWRGDLSGITLGSATYPLFAGVFGICVVGLVHHIQRHKSMGTFLFALPVWQRWAIYYAVVMTIILFGQYSVPVQFIYFQF